MTNEFAIVTRDEIWSSGTLVERRLSHGVAVTRAYEIHATDRCDEALLADVDSEIERARVVVATMVDARIRIVTTGRRVGGWAGVSSSLSIARQSVSLVTTPEYAVRDAALLSAPLPAARGEGGPAKRVPGEGLPILWRNGSGAVFLHEAVGHAAEHGHFTSWPSWLSVRDEPVDPVDDVGAPSSHTDLLAERPRSLRRQTFTDVPLPRMTNVVVRQNGAPFDLPQRRIEVHLVGGGRYEPLDRTVRLHVTAASLVDGDSSQPIAPFVITERLALIGASGEPQRYPGVVCSREGQELVVGSHAPLLLTRFV